MAEENAKLEQNQKEKPMSLLTMTLWTGFIGGLLWGGIGYLAYVFNFTEIHPNVVLEPWALGAWKKQWLGTVISIIVIGVFSIVAALIYYVALKKIKSIFAGIGYGIALFFLVFLVLNPIFPSMEPIRQLDRDTIITSICLYVLYGTFIGFSISYEFEEQQYREKRDKEIPTS
ncbi:YqhR family membrane protein [Robertmurraya andreesenii]|uniref:CBS domain containing-hemolysin-like protein n=1 Tax=Anoxybacillus andreesenii TaxID=1325932 RepID=A0ABT9V648_9BACL|nr:YqhR family membrane protein [Robertmurraya andreesenii]MDQ0156421.1 CBS domain containing-hemolysin-like protein [Robertmurraya andreesenii]